MPAIIGSFEYSGTDYLDKRVSFSSLTALETQTDIKFPNGFECWCESEQTWYQLSTTNPDDISTYIWSERPSGDATIIVDGVQTSDYKFVINRNETEAAYGDVANAILQQVTSMFTSLQDTINKQNDRINTLELEIENLKAPNLHVDLHNIDGTDLIRFTYDKSIKKSGDVSSCNENWNGCVRAIVVYSKSAL